MLKKLQIISAVLCMALTACGKETEEAVPAIAQVTETTAVHTTVTEISTTPTTTETTITTTTEPPAKWQEVSFAAVGDNLIHSSIYNQAAKRAGNEGYDFTFAFENAVDLIAPADVAIINQETLICNDVYEPSTYPRFNSPAALGDHMLDIGFDVFTIANNHTLDKNTDGLNACLDYWDSRENAVVAGAYRNQEDKNNIRLNEVNGVTFSYLSYTESLNGLYLPSDSPLVIGDANDIDGIVKDIEAAEQVSDVCVVALHWGVENSDVISQHQRNYAKILAEAGADIIIGNHPHVLRNIEYIERDDGSKALCAYSLGNFISAQSVAQNLIGGVLQFKVSAYVSDTIETDEQPVISDVKLIPIVTHYDYGYSDVHICKLSDYTPELAKAHGVNSYSRMTYDYIIDVLKLNINEEFLVLPEQAE